MNSFPEKFSLKWNDYEHNLKSTFRLVKTNEDFCDVTVCVEDNSQFEAHKVVLAAGSDFFSDVLRKAKHPHPFIYLKGVQAEQMEAILNFFYSGEASVAQLELANFLQVAQDLKVKGLAEGVAEADKSVPRKRIPPTTVQHPPPPPQQSSFVGQIREPEPRKVEQLVNIAPAPVQQTQTVFADTDFKTEHDVDEIQEIHEIYETEDQNLMQDVYEDTTIVDTTIVPTEYHHGIPEEYLPDRDPERPFFCEKCWKNFKTKASLKDHISWVHTGADMVYSCTICGKTDMTKKGLANHKYIKHSDGKGARSRKLKASLALGNNIQPEADNVILSGNAITSGNVITTAGHAITAGNVTTAGNTITSGNVITSGNAQLPIINHYY